MAHRSVAIANEFLAIPEARESLTQMQLQKLVYISHGWNLAINDEPLTEAPEAWEYGPVYPDLYNHIKYFGRNAIGRAITPQDADLARFFIRPQPNADPYRAELNQRERAIIEHVWRRYGRLSAARLSALTHQRGTPWFETFTRKGRNSLIPEDLIKAHYKQLAEDARSRT